MNTKKEAKELVDKFHNELDYEIEGYKDILKRVAKQCALLCVDEVISSGLNLVDYKIYSGDIRNCLNYWQEVKQEINKL